MLRLLLAAPLALIALPAVAQNAPVSGASAESAKRCTMQPAHNPTNKQFPNPPVMTCAHVSAELADKQPVEVQAIAMK